MNLFFLAVLLTPVPLPQRNRSSLSLASKQIPKTSPETETAMKRFISTLKTLQPPLITHPHPIEWTPHPLAIITPLSVLFICVFLLPFSASTPQFFSFLLIPHIVLFRPVYLDRLAPIAYGSTKRSHRTYLAVYRFLSYASFALYAKQTFVAFLDNDPGAYEHRHSHYLASLHLPHEDERGAVSRTTGSISRILSALYDHPAMATVGWDVLMCTFSLTAWATVRGLDISKIASAAGLIELSTKPVSDAMKTISNKARSSSVTSDGNTSLGPRPRRRRKSARAGEEAEKDGDFAVSKAVSKVVLGEEEEPENLEAGAVSWVMFALGGLGVLASGVLGAEFET